MTPATVANMREFPFKDFLIFLAALCVFCIGVPFAVVFSLGIDGLDVYFVSLGLATVGCVAANLVRGPHKWDY